MKQTAERTMAPATKMSTEEKIPIALSKELRSLAHDLSNSIECIMQACYLLNTSKLDETSKKWAEMIDQGARDAAQINRQIRDILRTKSEVQS
jgi:nitrogen-specific signal transduction histidine kinase